MWNEGHRDGVSVKGRKWPFNETKGNQNADEVHHKGCFKMLGDPRAQLPHRFGHGERTAQRCVCNIVFPFDNYRYVSQTLCKEPGDSKDPLLLQMKEEKQRH